MQLAEFEACVIRFYSWWSWNQRPKLILERAGDLIHLLKFLHAVAVDVVIYLLERKVNQTSRMCVFFLVYTIPG